MGGSPRVSGLNRLAGKRRGETGPRRREPGLPEHHHRDISGGGARAAVFGISDGLVSNTSLVLGIAGASAGAGIVRLAGLAGLLGGAFSMAAGEYISMRAQSELFQREIEIERREIERRPEGELRELIHLYETRGLPPELAHQVAKEMMSDPQTALETHAREELGIDPSSTGKPVQAAVSSFVTFALGAFMPLLPFLFTHGSPATLWAVAVAGVSALVVGTFLSLFTGRRWWFSALRQLLICAAAGAITFGVGSAIGVSGVG
ncbi:MAG TPA: VIT1/CCC1 transporter family protein [Acidimicrobiales bacterium]|nr:VIT1/CCC1 transporter family protein [Acidimicrobiales bacterium]